MANKTIKNLTKYDISIVDYKKNLVKQSQCSCRFLTITKRLIIYIYVGNAAIEKAKLFSKSAPKGRT